MSATNLTKEEKMAIVKLVLAESYIDLRSEIQQSIDELSAKIYNHFYSQEMQERINSLPEGALLSSNKIRVGVTNIKEGVVTEYEMYFTAFDKELITRNRNERYPKWEGWRGGELCEGKWPFSSSTLRRRVFLGSAGEAYRGGMVHILSYNHPLVKEIKDSLKRKYEANELLNTLAENLNDVLLSVRTKKRLLEIWPEGRVWVDKVVAEYANPPARVDMAPLNAMICSAIGPNSPTCTEEVKNASTE